MTNMWEFLNYMLRFYLLNATLLLCTNRIIKPENRAAADEIFLFHI